MNYFLYLMLTILCVTVGCSKSSDQKAAVEKNTVLRINIADDPSTLDPRKARSLSDRTLLNMLFEGLTRVNKEEKIEPALAQVIEVSSDMLSYTFYLRKANWTNGDRVTAADFAYAWKKALDPNFVADTASQLYPIKNAKAIKEGNLSADSLGVQVIDDTTLKVELEQATPYFLELTAFPIYFPVNQKVEESNVNWAEKDATFVGCGPFSIKKWKHNNLLEVVKNESYWDAAVVKLARIEMTMVKEDTELRMYEKNELDWAGSPLSILPVDALKTLRKEGILQSKPLLGTYFFRINTQSEPFNRLLIRKSFALAIDRQAIVDHILQGNQIPATGLVPISMGLQERPYFQDHDVQESKKLFQKGLKEMQAEDQSFPEITLIYPANERNHLISQAVQQQWREAFGIHVKLEALEKKVYLEALSHQDYQLAAGSWVADFNDPINFLEIFKYGTSGTNNTLWENEDYIYMLDKSSTIADSDYRRKILSQSEELLMREMPIIPVFYYTMLYTKQDRIKEMIVSSIGNLDFKWAYLENTE